MDKFFDLDNPVWSFFSKLANVFWLSILWTITSIPIVTMGASSAAMHYVIMKMIDERDIRITTGYFKSFKNNFFKATIVWIPLLIALLIGLVDITICINIGDYIGFTGAVIFMCIEIVLVLFSFYVFPLIGRFENTLKQTIKNGFLMPLKHWGCTLLVILVAFGVIALAVTFPPAIVILPGLMAFATSYPLFMAFKKYEPKEEIEQMKEASKATYDEINRKSNNRYNNRSNRENKNSRNKIGKAGSKRDTMF